METKNTEIVSPETEELTAPSAPETPAEAPVETPAEAPAEAPTETPAEPAPAKPVDKKSRRVVGLCLLLVVLAAGAGLFFSRYVPGPGGVYPRDAAELDLREESVSAADFAALQRKLPDCHIRWSVPVGGGAYDSQAERVEISALRGEEIELFTCFERLKTVDATGCGDYEALLALREARPDLEVLWTLPLEGAEYAQDTREIALNATGTDYAGLEEKLRFLPELESVTFHGAVPPAEQERLAGAYPELVFDWNVDLCGVSFRSTDTEISFAGMSLNEADLQEIQENVHRFYALQVVDLTGCGFDSARMARLREDTGVEVAWDFELYGVAVTSLDTTVNLSDIPIKDLTELEEAIPLFSRLERIEMHHCGVDNETMDALNKKYEDIRFVWTVRVKGYGVRTDATYFIVYNCTERYAGDAGTDQLKYCTDLIALDLGHMRLHDISFLQYMPKMKYLIFAECAITDISYIGQLKELEWLELFKASIRDISPLVGCTNLKQLNLCYIYADDSAYDTLVQMPWLERLWYAGNRMSEEQIESLRQALPDTQFYVEMGADSTGGSWRYHQSYYDMRDAFNMYYMTATGDRTTHVRIDPIP